MKIVVNGQEKDIPKNQSIASLIDLLGVNKSTVVAELNQVVIEKKDFSSTALQSGDRLELVRFLGGG